MRLRHCYALLLFTVLVAAASSAKEPPAPAVVDLATPDKIKLKATYFAAAGPGPGVLLLHQCNRERKVWNDLAQKLASSGIHVLTLDYRGFGESEGKPFATLKPFEVAQDLDKRPGDVDLALQFLESQPGVQRDAIGVGGASCSVRQSILASHRHTEVKAIALLSGDAGIDGRKILRASPNLPLFVAMADDDVNGLLTEYMRWIFGFSKSPASKLVHYTTGGHGVELFPVHKELPGQIVEWFNANLRHPVSAAAKKPTPAAQPNILDVIDEQPESGKAAKMLEEALHRNPKAAPFSEALVNLLGYEHLADGDVRGAVEIFKLNVAAYPDSPNAYDSLADAQLSAGYGELAEKSARKAIELLATDTKDSEERRNAIKANAEKKVGLSER
jgi:dienelactone hydrolase